jgi:ABC-2 type transport system permease protein
LPGAVQTLATALPFRWMISFPVELALGRVTPRAAALGMAAQLAWIALGGVLLTALWPRALRRFSSVGN